MHLLEVYRGKFRIFSIFSGYWAISHFHHCLFVIHEIATVWIVIESKKPSPAGTSNLL